MADRDGYMALCEGETLRCARVLWISGGASCWLELPLAAITRGSGRSSLCMRQRATCGRTSRAVHGCALALHTVHSRSVSTLLTGF